MEARAKQRLTGAIILVALFVLLVPELLTGPRDSHPSAESPGDEGLRRYTIELDAQSAANARAAPAQNPPVVALPAVPSATNPTLAAPGEAATPEGSAPKPAASSPAPSGSVPVPSPATPPYNAATPVSPKVVAPRGDSSHPAVADSAPKNAPAGGSFAVQLGTFGKRENADRLARDMTAKGFAASVVPTTTNGHELFRVRVGPARDRAAAEALAAQLKRVGQTGSIVPIS